MNLGIKLLALLGLIVLATSLKEATPEHATPLHQTSQKGCYKDKCWDYCSSTKRWCYTRKCMF